MKIFFVLFLFLSYPVTGAIEDNSFLIEEAFNQKRGEYQFIQNYQSSTDGDQEYFFQVEAPLTHEVHQISFDISHAKSFSDTLINYRYQAFKQNNLMLTERISFILPTGSVERKTGNGVYGVSFMQSATIPLKTRFMNHWNLGVTVYPEKTLTGLIGGSGLVYLYKDNLNFLLEALIETGQSFGLDGSVENETSFTLNPGLRFALDKEKSQTVPGVSFPFQYNEKRVYAGVFLYLSFEATLY